MCQGDAFGVTVEEGGSQMRFEQLDLPTDRAMRDVQGLRRLGQAGLCCGFVECLERAEMPEVFKQVRKSNIYTPRSR